jgi:hypothetical protein
LFNDISKVDRQCFASSTCPNGLEFLIKSSEFYSGSQMCSQLKNFVPGDESCNLYLWKYLKIGYHCYHAAPKNVVVPEHQEGFFNCLC